MKRFAVIIRKSWSQSQVGEPQFFDNKEDALKTVKDFNKSNQDHTWNAEQAYDDYDDDESV